MNKIVEYKNFKWYVLKENEETVTLFMKDLLSEEVVEDICDDNFMFNGYNIKHQDELRKYKWCESYIRKVLNDAFLEKYLDKNDLIMQEDDYVRLIKKDEVNSSNDMFKEKNCYWTMSNHNSSSSFVSYVNSLGHAINYYAGNHWLGVRPIIEVKKMALKKHHVVEQINGILYVDNYNVDELIEVYERRKGK